MKAPTPTPDDYNSEDRADIGDLLNEVRYAIACKDPQRASAWLLQDVSKVAHCPEDNSDLRMRWWALFLDEINVLKRNEMLAWLKEAGFRIAE